MVNDVSNTNHLHQANILHKLLEGNFCSDDVITDISNFTSIASEEIFWQLIAIVNFDLDEK